MPLPPDLRRTWHFGSASDRVAHLAMRDSGADLLIADLEDFTPPPRREKARELLPALLADWRTAGRVTAVRINQLDAEGPQDLAAAMRGQPDVIAYPMASSAAQMRDLDRAITSWEDTLGIAAGRTEILPVCETALGVTLSSAAASTKLPSRALASKALSAFSGGSLRGMGVFRRQRFSFSTRHNRRPQYSYTNSVRMSAPSAHGLID